MGILIDSSILIHFERAGTDISTYVKGREQAFATMSTGETPNGGGARHPVGRADAPHWSRDPHWAT